MATVLISGGTGLIGQHLTSKLTKLGHQVIVLTRHMPEQAHSVAGVSYARWNVSEGTIDSSAVQRADHIFHLAGANVASERWTPKRKKEISDSRTQSSALLIKALQETPNKVQSVLSASAIGWYGEDPRVPNPHPFMETQPPAEDFLGATCLLWEESIAPVTAMGIRLAIFRTGIVLANEGGALAEFKKPVRFGVAGIMGNGKQMVSWIHIDDLCNMYIWAMEHQEVHGAYNAVAPRPVSTKELTLQLASTMKGKFFVPAHIPAFVLRAMLGEMSTEVLKSTTVCSDKIRKAGYDFQFPAIEGAIDNLIRHQEE